MSDAQATRPALFVLLGAYLALALAYGVVTPLFEAPDEHHHFFTALYIADNGRLPRVTDPVDAFTRQEAAQPPLYYAAAAMLLRPFDTAGARASLWPNPFVRLGEIHARQNSNAFVHGPAEAWPWQDTALAAHALRAATAVLGLGTLLALHASARLLWPDEPGRALLATALVAFLPQFAFVNATISNDAAITCLAALAVWQWVRLERAGRPSTGAIVLLGVTIGLAALSKNQGVLLWPASAAIVGVLAWRRSPRPRFDAGQAVGLLSAVVIAVAGWLWWRNWQLYGDPTAANQFVALAGGARDFSWVEIARQLPRVWRSLFALFGWFNVPPPGWVNLLWNAIVIAAMGGGLLWLVRRRPRARLAGGWWTAPLLWLAAWTAVVFFAHLQFMRQTPADQGRLLFPALLPLALAVAAGLWQLPQKRYGLAVVTAGALLTSLAGTLFVIPRAYARPPAIAALPATAIPFEGELAPGLQLLGWTWAPETAVPGQWVEPILYWRAETTPTAAPVVVAELFGRDNALAGKQETYHGGGLYPASLWPAGSLIADPLRIRIDDAVDAPLLAPLFVRLAGGGTAVPLGAAKIVPAQWPAVGDNPLARLEGIGLASAELVPSALAPGESARITVRWAVDTPPGRDLTTFIHLGDPAAPPLLQADGPPRGGTYPARLWESGEVIDDEFVLTIPNDFPSGRYPVQIGLYDSTTGVRLAVFDGAERLPHDAWPVGPLTIRR